LLYRFLQNLSGHNTPINAVALNDDGVLVSCGDNGSLQFWDYESGYCFQKSNTIVQPGSLDAESGIYGAAFDLSGSRLLTCEADKTVKIWKENNTASDSTHPIDMNGWTKEWVALKRY
jgi:pleiotropic regulator 1